MRYGNRKSSRAGRVVGVASVVALAFGALSTSPARGAIATDDACPASIAEDGFTDTGTDGTAVEEAVDCLVAYGITAGQGGPKSFGTGNPVTRGQLATFVLNILDQVDGFARPANAPDAFPDDETSVHETNINDAAELGIINGRRNGTFGPDDPVQRDQMATFIVNTLDVAGVDVPAGPDAFGDDEASVHEANINSLAALDIVDGEADGAYNPARTVTRGTMAFFLTRTLEVLVDADLLQPIGAVTSAATTSRPELIAAAVTDTNTAAEMGADGSTVRFTFDEEVTGMPAPVATSFFVLDAQGDRFAGSATPSIETGGTSVLVQLAGITTDGAAGSLTVATVDFGAVTDNEGQGNPIGNAPLGTAIGSTGFTAGQTDAPDLTTVGNVVVDTAGAAKVDFTFDERAFTVNAGGFSVVLTSGAVFTCTAAAGTPGGQPGNGDPGATTITTGCPAPAAGQPGVTASTLARGIVQEDTVSDDQADQATATPPIAGCNADPNDNAVIPACVGSTNPLQASGTPDLATTDPDLASAALQRNVDQTAGSLDTVTFTFDEPVLLGSGTPAAAAARFLAYDVNGDQMTGASAERASEPTQVVVRFADTVVDAAVGASARPGAVTGQTGTTGRTNDADEVGVSNTGIRITGQTPGRTNGPDLTAVAISSGTSGAAQATFTFDEDIASLVAGTPVPPSPGGVGKLFLLQADGTRLVCTAARVNNTANGGSEETDDTVTCTAFAFSNDAGAATAVVANDAQVRNAVVGTIDDGAVVAEDGAPSNPEGAEATTGGTGTPVA